MNRLFTKEKKIEKEDGSFKKETFSRNLIKRSDTASHDNLKNVSDIYKSEYRGKMGGKF